MDVRQFISFRIGERLLGIDVLKVREINRALDICWIPHAPAYVRGIVNLRGQIITILDLGIRMNQIPREITEGSHNVVLKKDPVGLLVDDIGDVVQCKGDEVERPPANVGDMEITMIEGVVKLPDELMVVLAADRILDLGR